LNDDSSNIDEARVLWKSDIEKAIASWLRVGGSLGEKIPSGGDRVKSESAAKLICLAVDKALSETPIERYTEASYNLSTAIGFFQSVESKRAESLLRVQGLPRLRPVVTDSRGSLVAVRVFARGLYGGGAAIAPRLPKHTGVQNFEASNRMAMTQGGA
jgi:hypothetical protein